MRTPRGSTVQRKRVGIIVETEKQRIWRAVDTLRHRVDLLEEAKAKPESVAAACSGAGCPNLSEEPRGVLGPGRSLPKLQSLLKSRMAFYDSVTNPGISHFLINEELYKIHEYVSKLLGVEASEPPQDAE